MIEVVSLVSLASVRDVGAPLRQWTQASQGSDGRQAPRMISQQRRHSSIRRGAAMPVVGWHYGISRSSIWLKTHVWSSFFDVLRACVGSSPQFMLGL